MSVAAWLSIAIVSVVFGLLAFTRVAPYLVLLGGMTVMLALGILDPATALAGFANQGMITVGVLFVVAAGLDQTGVLAYLVHRFLGRPPTLSRAQARLVIPVAAGSGFLNNTPVVAMLTPVVKDWSRTTGFAASKLLIPLSYAAILGGLCTLIGTSTNLVINGLLTDAGHPPLSFFDPARVGLPCAVVGVLFMLVFGRHLLPDRATKSPAQLDPREYTVEMQIAPGGLLAGKTVEDAGLRSLPGLFLSEIYRGDHLIPTVGPHELLEAGDQLVFVGVVESVVDLQRIPGLEPATRQVFELDGHRVERSFVEAVVSRTSPLVGQSIREGRFRDRFGAVVLAVNRNGARVRGRIGDIRLRPGDALLLEATPAFVSNHRNSTDFYLVSELDAPPPPVHERAPAALAILGLMVSVAAIGLLSMLEAALLAAGMMLVTRCCTEERALRSVDWPLLLAIAASFALGRGLEDSGAAAAIAGALLAQAGTNPWLALAIIYLVTTTLSELVTNNAAAVIVFPIALATAETLGVSPTPFVIALMVAASASFATPLGYQTNLMVYGAGGYRFGDFARIGVPMNLVLWLTTTLVTPLVWPF
ncbi:anion permease [Pseudenhygromyxa sp. WMMC2535]|nr:SLC13 family permease [Pseudenhygromyxa sp. WMMC2535]NVB42622.1 anion permease [Pseudenhygromyxa sp. WMMC2535]